MEDIQVITQDYINVIITKSDSDDAAPIERRFKKGITVLEFKVGMIHTFLFFITQLSIYGYLFHRNIFERTGLMKIFNFCNKLAI